MRIAGWLVLSLALSSGAAHAIPAPIPEEQLEADAKAIVEGRVVTATFVKATKTSTYATAHYRGALKVLRVKKGDLKVGATIPLLWTIEVWIGKGLKPVGRGKEPAFYVCEVVRVYLWRSKKGWHVSGRRLVTSPPKYMTPTATKKTLRCVKGKPR
jgi:hypothetical protein